MQVNQHLFVITGGPGSGKTTTLLELERMGYPHLPEVARQIIREQVRAGGSALPWANRERYAQLMLQRSIESFLEHAQVTRTTFVDRRIPDAVGNARLIQLPEDATIRTACAQYRYAGRVFLAPPWKEIYVTDEERKQDFEEAQRTYLQIIEVYQDCNYELVELPRLSPQARAEFILRNLTAQP